MSDEYYQGLDFGLRTLLAEHSKMIAPGDAVEVEEFIEHSEYGVALVWLAHSMVESGAPISLPARGELSALAAVMGILDELPPELRESAGSGGWHSEHH